MPSTMTHLTQAELDRIMLEAKRAQARVIADGFRRLAAAVQRGVIASLHPVRSLPPRRRYGA